MKFIPHSYQRYAIERMISDPALGLFLDMGLGKTVITLSAVNDLRFNRWAVNRCLVVAPKKVAEATWSREAEKWDHLRRLRIIPVLGSAQKRIQALNTPGDVWVVNRENVPWLAEYYRNAWPFDMVVLDESSSFKNPQSKRFKALKMVRGRIRRLVELTGTPSPNGLADLYAPIYLLDGGARLGKTMASFRECFMVQDDSHPGQQYRTYSLQDGADRRIEEAIADICVSMKSEDYLELPDYIFDMSLVTACIRPSGASYRDQLLSRKQHYNPSEIIDELLVDNLGYLIYQEDTIKFLQLICGLSGSEADNVRRAIGRKQKDRVKGILAELLAVRKGRKLYELTLSDVNLAIRSGYGGATNAEITTPVQDVKLDKDKVITLGTVSVTVRRE